MTCAWPSGMCACLLAQQNAPEDYAGRVWMHCEEGLTMTKASMSRFVMFCLRNNVEIGRIHPFNAKYERCTVMATVRLRPDQFASFEHATGGRLRQPPRIKLNAEGAKA